MSYQLEITGLAVIKNPSRCLVTFLDLPFSDEMLSVNPGGSSLEPVLANGGMNLAKLQYFTLSDPDEVLSEHGLLDRALLCVERVYDQRLDDESLHVVQAPDGYRLLYASVTSDGGWTFTCPETEQEVRTSEWPTLVPGIGSLVGLVRAMVYEPSLPTIRSVGGLH
ncbi:hypothetical protein QU487_06980 [Crenobacter sp. SG2305]|uniref:hypothetical protein n=1 Tax=Crenobacter oryzisoli TaxID=3056844 RepID=UPI0025AA787D|nr:hypothetical protein [Crenobacter sp. SG2305]MDN0082499.1 hypothetical protein [Crenobacter sp. SG2305]